MSSTQRVQEWSQYRIPLRPRSPTPSILDESLRDESDWMPVWVDDTPVASRPLAAGQSTFDWDVGGSKTKEDLTAYTVARLTSAAKNALQSPEEFLPEGDLSTFI